MSILAHANPFAEQSKFENAPLGVGKNVMWDFLTSPQASFANQGASAGFANPLQATFGNGLIAHLGGGFSLNPQAYASDNGGVAGSNINVSNTGVPTPQVPNSNVLGSSTQSAPPSTGGNPPPAPSGGSSAQQQLDLMNQGKIPWDDNLRALLNNQINGANSAYQAQNQALNTQFDQAAANLQAQLPYLQQQRDSALSSLDLANKSATDQANSARLSAQTNTEDQINQAGDVAHQTQNQNRNILRALGIGGGTYAAELLSKPLNIYDQQRGQLNTALQQRSQQLDDYLNTVTQQHAQAVSDLQNNYANLVGKIQSDLRFNDRQRNDALSAANAALQTNLANIQSSAMQYQQQVQLMKQQLAQSAGTVTNYANPTYDQTAFQNALLSNPGTGNQFSTGNLQALTTPQKKNDLTLNDLVQGVQNGGLTLSGLGQ